ncbi:MAG: enoyl-CoA hydratase-related protein [Acidimicrobiales bacterium]|nr:enoyl-CoA hydratase-related protein [Acidimicrobiales bacterium]
MNEIHMESELVRTEIQGHISIISLHRKDKRNAFDIALTNALNEALDMFEDDPDQWVAVLTGGSDMFSAGSDLKEGSGKTHRGGEYGLIRRGRLKPIIAAAEGLALGGGMEILFCCDLIVASTDLRLGLPEVKRGVLPTSGGLFRALRSLPMHIAKEVVLTGEELSAERAFQYGLINRLVEPGQALPEAILLAGQIASNSPTATRNSLQAMERILASGDDLGWAMTDFARVEVFASEDRKEGIRAFFERRQPEWTGR